MNYEKELKQEAGTVVTRRWLFRDCGLGLGEIALGALLNDTVFQETAQTLALRIWKEGGSNDRDRAIYAFRLCTARKPDAMELERLLALVKEKESYFENRTTAAVQVSSTDPKNAPDDVNLHQVAAWTLASRVLLNLDETITKE
ncbi:MAG: Protein of unknown function (DUF1553)/Protein of unknown function (DUF1549)/Planctomycete [Pedosphaera sp.]|nr:Protein of unknown function (DUF1553)/Protein of unknown function (DUF1549)/Planctomycete [Pedosphaera sp.]